MPLHAATPPRCLHDIPCVPLLPAFVLIVASLALVHFTPCLIHYLLPLPHTAFCQPRCFALPPLHTFLLFSSQAGRSSSLCLALTPTCCMCCYLWDPSHTPHYCMDNYIFPMPPHYPTLPFSLWDHCITHPPQCGRGSPFVPQWWMPLFSAPAILLIVTLPSSGCLPATYHGPSCDFGFSGPVTPPLYLPTD